MERSDAPCSDDRRMVDQLLKFSDRELTPALVKYARVQLNETPENRIRGLQKMRDILRSDPDVQFFNEDHFLLIFLRFKKHNAEKAVSVMRRAMQHIYDYRNIFCKTEFEVVERVLDAGIFGFLKHRDQGDRAVFFVTLDKWNPHELKVGDLVYCVLVVGINSIFNPIQQVTGYTFIFDIRGLNVTHARMGLQWLIFFIRTIQCCWPGFLKSVHVVYTSPLYLVFWKIAKTFLTQKLRQRVAFHKYDNLEPMYAQIPREILYPDLGGDTPYSRDHMTEEVDPLMKKYSDVVQKNFYNSHRKKLERAGKSRSGTT